MVSCRKTSTPSSPRYDREELLGVMPMDYKRPVDMKEVIARIVDDSYFLEFGANYGSSTVCGHAKVEGLPVGIITNNGPIDPAGATKATHFIQACSQSQTPILYLNNTTGFMVGKEYEQAGIIKHGSDDPGGDQRHRAPDHHLLRCLLRGR